MVKHTQQPTNCLSVFDHFVGLALKGLNTYLYCVKKTQLLWKIYLQNVNTANKWKIKIVCNCNSRVTCAQLFDDYSIKNVAVASVTKRKVIGDHCQISILV